MLIVLILSKYTLCLKSSSICHILILIERFRKYFECSFTERMNAVEKGFLYIFQNINIIKNTFFTLYIDFHYLFLLQLSKRFRFETASIVTNNDNF